MSESTRPFVHLHCHSHYSLLDGAASIPKLIKRCKERGMNALALTDHGNLHGALEFYKKARDAGIKPIIGYEAYVAPGSRYERDAQSSKEAAYHLTLLAKNRVGFRNLVKMASHASLEGFYFKPRIDRELLEKYSEGIICLSGCVSSEFSRAILSNAPEELRVKHATEVAKWFQKVFGDRFFLEIMNNGVEIQRLALEGTADISKRMGLPMVATSDTHYADAEDAEAQDVMLCINTGKFRTDTQRMKMDGGEYYLRTPEQMYEKFVGLEDAVARSQEIANTVDIDLELSKRYFPVFRAPEEKSSSDYLRELCVKGLFERYEGDAARINPDGTLATVVAQRLDRELDVIHRLGFDNYFLIVWDFVRHAREQGIPATARGSGVGALVCYALYLSHVCPIKYDLLFERFLDINRKEAPDIDIDFCKDRRGEVIRYVKDKYGEDNVAQIGTFGTLAAKAAIKDVGRVMGMPVARANEITSLVPEQLHISLEDALKTSVELKKAYESDPEVRELLDLAQRIEGLARNVGTHAAAVVIADRPLTEYVPLGRVTGKTDVITQWSMGDVEAAGLLKMDFLGLRNLTILSKAVELIEQTTGQKIDPYKFPLDDKKTFALLQRGETKGIFQLESGGIRDLLIRMKPDHFSDIIATNALYRPGPLEGGMVDDYVDVKHGRKRAEYIHPICEKILGETNGVMVYQEQVMRILNELGGIELASSYACIKAISKKKEEVIAKNREQFVKGSVEKGISEEQAESFWAMIIKFAGYGFNKSHSTAYALIAYMTAYLKAHFPVEFMAALLSGDIQGRNFKTKDSLSEHLEDAERMRIVVVPPNVNESDMDFSVRDGRIHFGLSAIKGCGGSAGDAIVAARKKGGFRDLFDFCERVDPTQCGKAPIETLIRAGAFDFIGARRAQLAAILDRAISSGASKAADRKSGQRSLFGDDDEKTETKSLMGLPDIPEWPDREKLQFEKEVLGFYLSSHPLKEHERTLQMFAQHSTKDIPQLTDRGEAILGGLISAIKLANTKNPKPGAPSRYANFDLEDTRGIIRCILWPDGYAQFGQHVVGESIVLIRGAVDRRGGEEANLIVNEIIPLSELGARFTSGLLVRVDEQKHGMDSLPKLREILRAYPGQQEVEFVLSLGDASRVYLKTSRTRVTVNDELHARLDDLLGPGNVQRKITKPKIQANGDRDRFRRNHAEQQGARV